jgi:ABC-type Fe3+-hydroxamate transport system substrate-binding protein
MKTAELVKKCQDRMKSIRDKIETKRKSKKVYSEEDLRKAYFSGISSTGEGWNGEYADGNDPNIEEKFSEGFTQWFEQFKKK